MPYGDVALPFDETFNFSFAFPREEFCFPLQRKDNEFPF